MLRLPVAGRGYESDEGFNRGRSLGEQPLDSPRSGDVMDHAAEASSLGLRQVPHDGLVHDDQGIFGRQACGCRPEVLDGVAADHAGWMAPRPGNRRLQAPITIQLVGPDAGTKPAHIRRIP